MNKIECKLCNKETIIVDNKCQHCDCSIFIGRNIENIEQIENYNLIIEDISIKAKIEKEIVEKLFRLSLISTFVKKIDVYNHSNKNAVYLPAIRFHFENDTLLIFIEKYISKKNEYSNAYLYFKYNLININTYLNEYQQIYMHFKNNENIILSLREDTISNEILGFNIKFNLQDYCLHPLEWLNREEKINLKRNINTFFKIYSINDEEYIRYIINLDLNKEKVENLLNDIDVKITEFIDLNNLEKEKIKEINLKYFERVLLEKEIKNF